MAPVQRAQRQPGPHGATAAASPRPAWLDPSLYPFRSRYLDLDGHVVHYVDEGEGPVLLFLHTAPIWSFYYRDAVRALRDRFRCVALDYPGFGLSRPSPGHRTTLAATTAVVERFVPALDLRGVTMVGHGIGVPLGLGAASRDPSRFDALVLSCGFGWPLDPYPAVVRTIRLLDSPVFGLLNDRLNLFARAVTMRPAAGANLPGPGKRAYHAPLATREARRNGVLLVASALDPEHLPAVERAWKAALADRPTLLFWGEKDPGIRAGYVARFERELPNHRTVLVPGVGHFPLAQAPERFVATLGEWWASAVAPAAVGER